MDIEKLLLAWNKTFGKRPVLATALHWQATNGHVELASSLGQPLPSVKSLGRLLASNSEKVINGLFLVRCHGRVSKGVLWRLETDGTQRVCETTSNHGRIEDGSRMSSRIETAYPTPFQIMKPKENN